MLRSVSSIWKLGASSLRSNIRNQLYFIQERMKNTNNPGPEFFTKTAFDVENETKDSYWLTFNDRVYPPQAPGEEPRPAFVCHTLQKLKYSPKKMWVAACFVRGMQVDDAIKQIESARNKGCAIIARAIKEAVELAVNEHDVEYRSNLWIAESFATRAMVIKGMRRCARGRMTQIKYKYCNYYIRLEEGKPPVDYYNRDHLWTGEAMLERHIENLHSRRIPNSL